MGQQSDIELTQMDSIQEPLLSPRALAYQQNSAFASQQSLTSLSPAMYQNPNGSEAPLHRPQDRSYSPSPAYTPSDALYNSTYSPSEDSRRASGNLLAGQQRSQSPFGQPPYTHSQSPSQQYPSQQYPPQHSRQASGNVLAGQHSRQASGNMLARSDSPRSATPSQQGMQSPSPRSSQQHLQQRHSRQADNTNMAGRGAHRAF